MKPIKQFRDEVNRLISASVFQHKFGKSIALQASYRKGNKLVQKNLTILEKNVKPVLNVLGQVEQFIKESK